MDRINHISLEDYLEAVICSEMSSNASMGGIIAQGPKVEKLQEVQHQGPEWRRQKALTAAEEEKLKQQQQVRKTPEGEKNLSVTEREPQHHERTDSDNPADKEEEQENKTHSRPRTSGGGQIIDIIV